MAPERMVAERMVAAPRRTVDHCAPRRLIPLGPTCSPDRGWAGRQAARQAPDTPVQRRSDSVARPGRTVPVREPAPGPDAVETTKAGLLSTGVLSTGVLSTGAPSTAVLGIGPRLVAHADHSSPPVRGRARRADRWDWSVPGAAVDRWDHRAPGARRWAGSTRLRPRRARCGCRWSRIRHRRPKAGRYRTARPACWRPHARPSPGGQRSRVPPRGPSPRRARAGVRPRDLVQPRRVTLPARR